MTVYKAPVADSLFILNDVLKMEQYGHLEGFADATPDLVAAVLEEGGKLASEVLHPLNAVGDHEGCRLNADGTVTTPTGFKEAYAQYREGGWMGLPLPVEYGGQGLPSVLNVAFLEYVTAANLAWGMYPGLTQGAIAALLTHASDEIKQTYVPKMASGEWLGTMNLTEPHCGTDLGMLRTKAVPQPDGTYKISGQKIFISAGDNDFTANIVHLVLARIEGAPQGTKGISLFVVPKFLPDAKGEPGAKNAVACGKLEEKMGIHGNATCVMNYDGATGWLVGAENKGLAAMFVMMNEARLGVAIQGLSLSDVAYQNAVIYAKDRIQGRSLTGPKNPEKQADPIIVHPDVRRNLMQIRAFNEASRAFALSAGLAADVSHRSPDASERQKADDYLGLMTPVLKGFLTDVGFDNTVRAQQMYGGHGFIEEWGMSQFVRDARIAMIYEGANGIQALDLVGRKLGANGGRAIMTYFADLTAEIEAAEKDESLAFITKQLKKSLGHAQQAAMWFMQNAMTNPDNAGAGSYDFMHLMGLLALGQMWLKIIIASKAKLAQGDDPRFADKLVIGRYYAERMLPETGGHLIRIQAGSEAIMALAADSF